MIKFLQRYFERRSLAHPSPEVLRLFDAGPTAAGMAVSPRRALSVPAVFACVSALATDVARTPIRFRRRVAPDTYEFATDHDLYEILGSLPNAETTAFCFKDQMMRDLLTYEVAYAEIVRVEGTVTALWRLDPERMTVDRDDGRRKRWTYHDERGRRFQWLFDASRPPILELSHPSPIRHCRELIGTALALQRYVGKFFSQGARLGGILLTDVLLEEEQEQQISASFNKMHEGTENAWKTAVLQGGLKFQPVSAPNDQAQLNETLQTIRTEIAGAWGVPTWRIGDLSKATYSNMEAGWNQYLTSTLDPLFQAWEEALRRDVLTTRQYGAYDVIFDRSTLIRSDVKSLHEALARGRDAGIYSTNDARRALGLNPIPVSAGGDAYLVNGNLTPIVEAGSHEQQ